MITSQVDFSAHLGAARDQGPRPTCLVFAASDLNAAAHGAAHLSAEHLCHSAAKACGDWHPGRGFQLEHVLGAVGAPGQPLEALYPYQPDGHDAPLKPPPDGHKLYTSPSARQQDLTTADVIGLVRSGKPIGLVIQVCEALFSPVDGVVAFDPYVIPDQYHAVLAVGLGVDAATGHSHVLVRNSWGPSWGLGGHAWMSVALLDVLLVESFLI